MLPLIPLYVRELGGSESVVGIVLGLFSFASFTIRPYIGRIVDKWDPARVLGLGSLLLGAAALGMLLPVMVFVMLANTLRGVAWAGINTGANTLLAQLSPVDRRGEAAGYLAFFPAIAGTIGPPLSVFLLTTLDSFPTVMGLAFVFGVLGIYLSRPLFDEHTPAVDLVREMFKSEEHDRLIERSAILPSVLLIFVSLSQAAVLGFAPLYAADRGLSAASLTGFYLANGLAAMAGRFLLGRVADRQGRGFAILEGALLKIAALIGLMFAHIVPIFLLSGCLYAFGHALAYPALTALAIDRADSRRMGASMATFSAAFQVGNGVGAMLTGSLLAVMSYTTMYGVMAAVLVAALGLVAWHWPELRSQRES